MSLSKMNQIIDCALFTPTEYGFGESTLFEAVPGTGKTTILRQRAAYWGLLSEVLSPGERGEGAFGVICVPVDGYLKALPPGWTEKFHPAEGVETIVRGLVILDEMKSAPPALHPPLLGLSLGKMIGETRLSWYVRVLALTNAAAQAAYGQELSDANNNRFMHIQWEEPTVAEHNAYASSIDVHTAPKHWEQQEDAEAHEKHVVTEWRKWAWAEACSVINAFLEANVGLKNQCPTEENPATGPAWASDRTWITARRVYASGLIHKVDKSVLETMVEGCIGHETAQELWSFRDKLDLPNIASMLDGGPHFPNAPEKRWEHTDARPDRTAAVLAGAATLVAPEKAERRKPRSAATWSLLADLIAKKATLDLLVPACKTLINAPKPVYSDKSVGVLAKLRPLMSEADAALANIQKTS